MRTTLSLVSALLLCAGCVPSVNPFYLESDVIFEPALVGEWREPAREGNSGKPPDSVWSFAKGRTGKHYELSTFSEGKRGEFTAHLFKLGNERFLDLQPKQELMESVHLDPYYTISQIPGHLLLKVERLDSVLFWRLMDPEYLSKLLEKNPRAIAHRRGASGDSDRKDAIFLTATSKELRAFIVKHSKEKGFWMDEGSNAENGLVRAPKGTAPPNRGQP